MKRAIEWLKEAVLFCSKAVYESDSTRERVFKDLEKRYMSLSDKEVEYIIEVFEREFLPNDLVYIYSWLCTFIQENKFGKSLVKAMKNGEFDLRTSILFELEAACYGTDEWKERYELRQKTVNMMKEKLNLQLPYRKLEERNQKEIVIITEQILSMLHAPTKIVMENIRCLQNDLGYNVTLIICPLNGSIPIEIWGGYQQLMNVGETVDDRFKAGKWKYKDTEIKHCLMTFEGDFESKYKTILTLIHDINPLFVLGCGVNNPIVDMCGEFTTLVNRGMSKKCPISVADILVRMDLCDDAEEEMYKKTLLEHQRQLFLKHTEPIVVEEVKGEYTREMYNLPEDAFVMCIVGNRLDGEIDSVFMEMLVRVMEQCENVHLATIGEVEKAKQHFEKPVFDNRIHYLGFCNELSGTYKTMDLYVNLIRQGGGWSGGIAVMSELPVVTLGDCDVAGHVGEEFIVDDVNQMVEEIIHLASDKEYYAMKKQKAIDRKEAMAKNGMKAVVSEMLEEVIKIMKEDSPSV